MDKTVEKREPTGVESKESLNEEPSEQERVFVSKL